MKTGLVLLAVLLFSPLAYSLGLHCENAQGYTITESRGLRAPWPKLTVFKNGRVVLSQMHEDVSSILGRSSVPENRERTIRATGSQNGVATSVELLIKYETEWGPDATANVILKRGAQTVIAVDFKCRVS